MGQREVLRVRAFSVLSSGGVPDALAVEDLISSKLNNKRKLARLITQYRDIFFQYFGRHGLPSLIFRVLQSLFNFTSLKYGKYDITNEKINNNKRLIDRLSNKYR